MADLIYRPQNIIDPRNHPRRIYFSCTEADLQYFDRIAQDIWKIYSDCVIAHRDFSRELDLEDHFDQIDNVQLMVIPVTKQLLDTENFAWNTEFQRAAEKHISILPFLMDAEVQEKFNEKSGQRQCLVPSDPDYEEKLQRCLRDALVSDEMAQRVADAFPLKMFLSYCREDREQVAALMKKIHEKEENRQIAIWYDKYLTMGVNFEDTLFQQMEACQLFGMTVTPHLVGRDNYVREKEYPYAVDNNKRIILFEMLPTAKEDLQVFEGVEKFRLIEAKNEKEFHTLLSDSIKDFAKQPRSGKPGETDFLVGMAYLNGLRVEFDRDYARQKLEQAGNGGSLEAVRQLVTMYRNGIGTQRDANKAIKWKKKEAEKTGADYQRAFDALFAYTNPDGKGQFHMRQPDEQKLKDLLDTFVEAAALHYGAVNELARLLNEEGKTKEADKRYERLQQMTQQVDKYFPMLQFGDNFALTGSTEQVLMHMVQGRQTDSLQENWERAKAYYQKHPDSYNAAHNAAHTAYMYALQIMRTEVEEYMPAAGSLLVESGKIVEQYLKRNPKEKTFLEMQIKVYRDLGRVLLMMKEFDQAERALHKACDLAQQRIQADAGNPYLPFLPAQIYQLLGDVFARKEEQQIAHTHYQISLAMLQQIEDDARGKALPGDYYPSIYDSRALAWLRIADLDEIESDALAQMQAVYSQLANLPEDQKNFGSVQNRMQRLDRRINQMLQAED